VPDPLDIVLSRERVRELHQAIEQLDERGQIVVRCLDLLDWRVAEVAEHLDLSVSRIHQLHSKALKDLRPLLRGQAPVT
jgi:RNA polymerase sigma factor (sigma-70 family)